MSTTGWRFVGGVAPAALWAARVELHWAAQIVAAAADRWIPAQPDDSHTTMTWRPDLGAVVGQPFPAGPVGGLAIGVNLERLAAILVRGNEVLETLRLAGRTLDDALRWTEEVVMDPATPATPLVRRSYDLPPRPDGPFEHQPAALVELARWYHDATIALATATAGAPSATPVQIWPHHFDVGAILYLETPDAHARQVGLGLSPGDASYAEPYFYVTPYPVPPGAQFPALPPGAHWHTEGFTGAILAGTAFVDGTPAADGQFARAYEFLSTAIAAAQIVIGG